MHTSDSSQPIARYRLCWLVTAFLLLVLPAGYVAAQEGAPNVNHPQLGDEVQYISESGSVMAILKTTQLELNWAEFSEYYTPTEGRTYVAIVVEVTNTGTRGSLVVRADDFRLQDIDGFLLSRSWADAADNASLVPAEGEIAIRAGQTEEIVLIYEAWSGVELGQLFWQPEYERLLTVVDLAGNIPEA